MTYTSSAPDTGYRWRQRARVAALARARLDRNIGLCKFVGQLRGRWADQIGR